MKWNIYQGSPLALSVTLSSGQAFRWRKDSTNVWWGTIGNLGVALSKPNEGADAPLYWQTFPLENRWEVVSDYLRLDVDVDALYREWIKREPAIAEATRRFRGLRVLRQPPQECLFSFLCTTCNTVTKIERTVSKLALRYGEPIASPNEENGEQTPELFAFPTLLALAEADEALLRSDLWGYRAPRIIQAARSLSRLPSDYLLALRQRPLAEVRSALTSLHGIGTKLADCIALFSLDKDEAVPVDTHIRQIAVRHFAPLLSEKSLTPRVYAEIENAYRDRFGDYAGWAQQYLFFGELKRAETLAGCPD